MNLEQILSIRRSLGGEGGDAHLGKVRQLLKPPCAPSSDKNEVQAKAAPEPAWGRGGELCQPKERKHFCYWKCWKAPAVRRSRWTSALLLNLHILFETSQISPVSGWFLQISVISCLVQLFLAFMEAREESQQSWTQFNGWIVFILLWNTEPRSFSFVYCFSTGQTQMFLLCPRIFLMLLFRCFYFAWNSKCILPRISKLVLFIFFFLRVSCQFLNTGFSCCQWIALICRWELMRCSFLSAELCQEFRVRPWWIRKSGEENSWLDFPKQKLFPIVWKQNAQNNSNVDWWDESEWRKKEHGLMNVLFVLFME